MKNLNADELLGAIGLQRRQEPPDYLVTALGLFGAGLVVGAGLGMLFAPKPGAELRRDIGGKVGDNFQALQDQVQKLAEKVQGLSSGEGRVPVTRGEGGAPGGAPPLTGPNPGTTGGNVPKA